MKRKLMMYWISLIADKISIQINGLNAGTSISIPAFTSRRGEISNFNLDSVSTVCATMYPSVYVPDALPYTWSMVFVSNTGGTGSTWESLFNGDKTTRRIPDYSQEEPVGAIEPEKIALFVQMHSFKTLIVKEGDTEKTIFN